MTLAADLGELRAGIPLGTGASLLHTQGNFALGYRLLAEVLMARGALREAEEAANKHMRRWKAQPRPAAPQSSIPRMSSGVRLTTRDGAEMRAFHQMNIQIQIIKMTLTADFSKLKAGIPL